MSELVPFIVAGLTAGAVYGLAGVGLVLTYKTSAVFNFAHGALATVAAYAFYGLFITSGWPWPLAAAVAILVLGPIMGLVVEVMARRLTGAPLALRVASTVGLLLVINAVITLTYGATEQRVVPVFLASGSIQISGSAVQWADIITFVVATVVTLALSAFFRFSRRGVAMRAVVDNPELLDIAGTSPVVTRRLAWVIGVSLASASGVLFAPLLPLDPLQLTLLVVAAFGAAAIGAFTSLPLTLVGGLVIGVLASLCTKWFSTGLLSGLPPSLPFVVLFVVLLVFPKRYLIGRSFEVPRSRSPWRAPASLQAGVGLVLVVGLATVPAFAGAHLTDWTIAVATAIVFMSLSVLVRLSGQVSLAHVSFTAIGAAAFSHLAVGQGIPWVFALVLSGLVAVPIGAMLAIPAIRLTGLYLALATFGFGILLQDMFYSQGVMFGASNAGLDEPRPSLSWVDLSSDKGYFYVVLALAAAVGVLITTIDRTRLGRLMRGMADSPTALETNGTSVNVTRVLVFCLSAFLAAVGGALVAIAQGAASADSYQPLTSLTYFALIVIVVGGAPWDAILAAGVLVLVPSYVSGDRTTTILQLLFGATAILVAVLPAGTVGGVPLRLRAAIDARFRGVRARRSRGGPEADVAVPRISGDGALELRDIEVRFGGLVAVGGLSLRAPTGRITGLIGPNGAGKTTTFNACSGLNRPASGTVLIDGHDVSRSRSATRARRGLGRTFQKMELFDSLTVRENVAAGAEGVLAGANPLSQIVGRPGDRGHVAAVAQRALDLCDIGAIADEPVSQLSTGQRRLVELARCLAGPFRVLLLDEPSSGLDRVETERFGQILKSVVAERGVGILLVEHDMSLVADVCEDVYVLDFGRLIFHGPATEITSSPIVQAAYLGDPSVEEITPIEPDLEAVSQ